ncbi:CtsR family transcriptional regulator [Fodinisporobacter ferrooxydans]|uniref:Transcriptional regulator CtsR n=1 Tax=Fodinisporobacter ferrooxydans TaxID=2901836 RepID=A0ABY4CRJ4_9BACL|nr:CtsR family transcriptional regulator [Alicyclobacillaceae bacterium MYW30-H2]
MRNISDIIEQHLKAILNASKSGIVEIQRSEIAELFQCVPSQINYVLNTRFTVAKGYYVESKRGGGGYIRIRKLDLHGKHIHQTILDEVGETVTQKQAEDIIGRLYEAGLLSAREATILISIMDRDVLNLQIPFRDELRSRILNAMIVALLRH